MSEHNFWCAVMAVIVLAIGVGMCLIGWWSARKEKRESSAIPVFTVEDLRRTPGGGR